MSWAGSCGSVSTTIFNVVIRVSMVADRVFIWTRATASWLLHAFMWALTLISVSVVFDRVVQMSGVLSGHAVWWACVCLDGLSFGRACMCIS